MVGFYQKINGGSGKDEILYYKYRKCYIELYKLKIMFFIEKKLKIMFKYPKKN